MAHFAFTVVGIVTLVHFCLAFPAVARDGTPAPPAYCLAWSTLLGGSQGEQAREIIVCPDGSLLVGGASTSPDIPTTPGAFQRDYRGEPAGAGHPGVYGGDCYLARLSPDGRKLLAATYLGGSRQERTVYGMALGAKGHVIVAGATRSPDFPTTSGACRTSYSGSAVPEGHDGFAAQLSLDLTRLVWSTFLGGCWPRGGLALDAQDNVCVVGNTDDADFPVTLPPIAPPRADDAFLIKVRSDGSQIIWSRLVGGAGSDGLMGAAIDQDGNIFATGHSTSIDLPATPYAPQTQPSGESDAWIMRMFADGTRILWLTFLGGGRNEFAEHRPCLTSDGVVVTGVTSSPDFPTTPQAVQRQLRGDNDGYVAKYSRDGRLLWSTLLGGSGGDFWLMPTPDPANNIILVGQTSSPDLPITADAIQPHYGGGETDGAMVILTADGSAVLYATYLGGTGADMIRSVTRGPDGAIYLVGSTSSADFPVTADSFQTRLRGPGDMFVVKLDAAARAVPPYRPLPPLTTPESPAVP